MEGREGGGETLARSGTVLDFPFAHAKNDFLALGCEGVGGLGGSSFGVLGWVCSAGRDRVERAL